MAYRFSSKSLAKLETAHPLLQRLFREAIRTSPVDMSVREGHRGEAAQNTLYAKGRSKVQWPNSKHNSLPSMAVDVVPWVNGGPTWDWPHYYPLADHIKATWASLPHQETAGWRLEWGGDWRSFKDGPHWQIVQVSK